MPFLVSAYEKSSKEVKNTETHISKRTSLELQSSTSEEDSGGGITTVNTKSSDKTLGTASSLLTSMQKRSFEMTGKDSGDNEGSGAAPFGRFRIERRNSKQQNGKLILDEGVRIFL